MEFLWPILAKIELICQQPQVGGAHPSSGVLEMMTGGWWGGLAMCQIVPLSFVWSTANQGIWMFGDFWKWHAIFKQIEYLTFLTGTFVVYAVCDADSTCCCFELLLLSVPHLIGEPPFQGKLKSAFTNKNNSLIQTVISFIFVEIYASGVTFPLLWIKRERNLLY